jgi:hypothetical protein
MSSLLAVSTPEEIIDVSSIGWNDFQEKECTLSCAVTRLQLTKYRE